MPGVNMQARVSLMRPGKGIWTPPSTYPILTFFRKRADGCSESTQREPHECTFVSHRRHCTVNDARVRPICHCDRALKRRLPLLISLNNSISLAFFGSETINQAHTMTFMLVVGAVMLVFGLVSSFVKRATKASKTAEGPVNAPKRDSDSFEGNV